MDVMAVPISGVEEGSVVPLLAAADLAAMAICIRASTVAMMREIVVAIAACTDWSSID